MALVVTKREELVDSETKTTPFGPDDKNPFTAIKNHTYLHNRDANDVAHLLITCLNLRAWDTFQPNNRAMDGSLYQKGLSNNELAFKDFMLKAKANGILPPDVSNAEMDGYIAYGRGFSLFAGALEDAKQAYKNDGAMLMKLRCLAESVYGSAVGGVNNNMILRMAALENGTSKSWRGF